MTPTTVKFPFKQRGLTLIELMISVLISSIILLATVNFFVAVSRGSATTLQASKLNQELLTLTTIMGAEIRRAGYSGDTGIIDDPESNIFNELNVSALAVRQSKAAPTTTPGASDPKECILFVYDQDEDAAIDANELIGFRLDNGVIQMRTQGDLTESRYDDCDDADETWLDLTDDQLITITNLEFDPSATACINLREPDELDNDGDGTIDNAEEADCYDASNIPTAGSGDLTVEVREITISVTGELNADSNTSATVSQTVLVRNDLVRER